MCEQKSSGSRNKFDEFFQWSRLEKDFWWIPPNQKKEFCGVRLSWCPSISYADFYTPYPLSAF